MRRQTKPSRTIKTAEHIFDILDSLQEQNVATPSELAQTVDLARSTIHDYLATLEYRGYIVQNGNGKYELGLRLLDHGMHAREQRTVTAFAQSAVERLAEKTGEGVRLWHQENGLAIILERVLGEQAVQLHPYDRIGSTTYLHSHSGGKAILAWLPREDIEDVIEEYGLPKQANKTITTPETLYDELEDIREKEVAFSRNESFDGVHSIAAPIIVDEVVGSISVAGPAHRFQGSFFDQELPELILGATNEIELEIAHSRET